MKHWPIWSLAGLTLASYLVLILILAPQLTAQSQGAPFDLRVLGYGLPEAQAYLATLTEAGRALYLGPIRVNDSIFPVLMTLLMLAPLRNGQGARLVRALPALAYGLLDLCENGVVAGILRLTPETLGAGQVALASALTQGKFLAFALAAVVALRAVWVNRRA